MVSSSALTTTDPATGHTVTLPVTVTTNIDGDVVQETDEWGTVTSFTYHPHQGTLASMTERTARGHSITTSYTYEPDGQLKDTSVGHAVLRTDFYDSAGRLARVTHANGTSATLRYGANGNQNSVSYSLTAGASAAETDTFSPAGRVLTRAITGPDQRTTAYTDDQNGRLVSATESGTIPVTATAWHYSYGDPRTSAGNRLSKTTTTPSGTSTSSYTYDGADRLTSSTSLAIGPHVTYDAAGRATTLGRDQLTYDAAGNLIKATDGSASATMLSGPGGVAAETVTGPHVSASWKYSGQDLILHADGTYAGQVLSLDPVSTCSSSATASGSGNTPTCSVTPPGRSPATRPRPAPPFMTPSAGPSPTPRRPQARSPTQPWPPSTRSAGAAVRPSGCTHP
ncbi:MAG TPA: RHS repeat domain-containing protein [Nakamurella sp.]